MSELSPSLQRNPDLDTWIRIDADGTVTFFTGKVELGQGLKTAIARIGAEELDVSLARIRVQTADTAHGPNELLTVGSGSMEESGTAMRQAAAEARQHLLELAAEHLGVAVEQPRGRRRHGIRPRQRPPHHLLGAVRRQEVRPRGHRRRRSRSGRPSYRIVGRAAERIDLAAHRDRQPRASCRI